MGGDRHSLLVTSRGGHVFTCGSDDLCQLGRRGQDGGCQSRMERVESLGPYTVVQAAVGSAHNLALDQWGKVFSWGWVDLKGN